VAAARSLSCVVADGVEMPQCCIRVIHGSSGPACEWQAGVGRRGVRCASHGSRAPPSLGGVNFRVLAFPDSARGSGWAIRSRRRIPGYPGISHEESQRKTS
jgi:hypothetical protein